MTATYDFFVIVRIFVLPKASGCTHVACSCYKHSQGKSKLIRIDAFTVITNARPQSVLSKLRIRVVVSTIERNKRLFDINNCRSKIKSAIIIMKTE